ncbi:hypothetical protein Trydic_g22473 [Trypoxylus dichotomus]
MFRYVFIVVLLINVNAEELTLSILKYKETLYCVLSNDSTNTAITWGTQNETTSYDHYNITELDGVQGRNWKLENSLENVFGFGPILDYRWESFPLRNHCRHQLPAKGTYELSISVLETDTVYLCETFNYEQCYVITFGFEGPSESGSTPNATGFCKNPNVLPPYKKWLHITITYGNNAMIIKQQGFETTYKVLQNVYSPRFLVIPGKWKLHAYNIYSSPQTGEVKLTLKDDLFRTTARVCLGLLVKAPVNDELTLTLQGDYSDSIASVTSKARNKWEELELCGEIKHNPNMKILIATKSRNSRVSIADIIRIISKDIRMKTTTDPRSHCCYAITGSEKICLNDLQKLNQHGKRGNQHCSHTTIGANCIPCQTFFNQIHCEKDVPICELKTSETTGDILCSCPSGYVGKNCTEQCPEGYHGFNCRERCNCTECNHITGACSMNTRMDNCYSTGESSGNSTYDISTTQNGATLGVSLRLGECNKKGKLIQYDIHLECISNWCSPNNSYHMNSTNDVTYFPILGYTNYSITIETHGEIQYRKVKTSFPTTPTAPNAVRDFIVYRITNTSVGLRWLEPYPPTGLLDKYTVLYGWPQLSRNIPANSSSCKIWTNYICSTIDGLKFDNYYHFEIYAKNYNVTEISTISRTYATTEDKVPAAPENLTYFWNETSDALIIKWNYPNIPIGNITNFIASIFDKTISLFKDFEDLAEYTYQFEYEELKANSSSNVSLTVYSYNGDAGLYSSPSKINVVIPPKTPKFTKSPTVVNVTAASFKLLLPNITDIDGEKSFLYVIITGVLPIKSASQHEELLKKANVSRILRSWIALNITISPGNFTNSIEINTTTVNHLDKVDQVTLLLHNQYKNISRYSSLTLNISIPSMDTYELYLLLALIPIIGLIIFAIYRLRKLKRSKSPAIVTFSKRLLPEENVYEELDLPEDLSFDKELYVEKSKYSNRVKLQDLQKYVKSCLDKQKFEKQYEMFEMGKTQEWQIGTKPQNQAKNRYKNIVAYDHTRVKLKIINKDPCSDYINANYIDGFNTTKAYIATQGPKSNTIDDFWRMVWQENVEYIIMIANITENGKKKIEKYWPDINEISTYSDISVTFSDILVFAEYETKTFKVTYQGKERTVYHLHFTCWPDHGVPFYPQSLAPFLKRTIKIPYGRSPIVVHCSAGVGRTGTFILCDICLRTAARTGYVDVSYYLHKLREQRINMVDNISQYKLIHLVLLHCLLESDFTIQCTEEMEAEVNKIILPKMISEQMKYIDDTFWQDEAMRSVSTKIEEPVVKEKNRFSNILPDGYSRLVLIADPPSDESSKYINAIKVDGFCAPFKFIVTQFPLSNTLGDFWRLVDQYTVSLIISLNTLDSTDKTCCKFYPNLNESMQPTSYMDIECTDVAKETHYNINTINIKNSNKLQESTIRIIHVNKWKYSMLHPEIPAPLLMTYEEMNSLGKTSNTILVTCVDGSRASGLYTSLCCLIDKIKMEQVCDVCLAVRTVRHSRTEFVREAAQFSFLYKCGLDYVQQFEMYSNFCSKNNNQ